ncbi:putative beta-glucosidase H, partial [Dissostichus eleginoides]
CPTEAIWGAGASGEPCKRAQTQHMETGVEGRKRGERGSKGDERNVSVSPYEQVEREVAEHLSSKVLPHTEHCGPEAILPPLTQEVPRILSMGEI